MLQLVPASAARRSPLALCAAERCTDESIKTMPFPSCRSGLRRTCFSLSRRAGLAPLPPFRLHGTTPAFARKGVSSASCPSGIVREAREIHEATGQPAKSRLDKLKHVPPKGQSRAASAARPILFPARDVAQTLLSAAVVHEERLDRSVEPGRLKPAPRRIADKLLPGSGIKLTTIGRSPC